MNELSVIILANDNNCKMNSNLSVCLHRVCGRPMIDWVLLATAEFGIQKRIVVTTQEDVKSCLEDKVPCVADLESAMRLCEKEPVLILQGNLPGLTAKLLIQVYEFYKKFNASVTKIMAGEKEIGRIVHGTSEREQVFRTEDEVYAPVTDRVSLSCREKMIYQRTALQLQMSGVTISDPSNTYLSPDVTVGRDTVILPGCYIHNSVIGEECMIGPQTELTNMKLGDRVKVKYSVATDSRIGDDTTVGPFAYIRPNSTIGEQVKIGDFVEIKNSVIDTGTKISHLTYVGDSDVGAGVNFGCGTVTVNYDGVHKHRTTIGDNAFIGCNTNLVAPVTVAPEAFIAAGSTITEDIPDDCLAIARARQTNIKGWVSNRKEKKSK